MPLQAPSVKISTIVLRVAGCRSVWCPRIGADRHSATQGITYAETRVNPVIPATGQAAVRCLHKEDKILNNVCGVKGLSNVA